MDQRELIGDLEEALRAAISGDRKTLWTALPAIVQTVDFSNMTITAQPTVQLKVLQSDGTWLWQNAPVLLFVPIVFPRGGPFMITFPITKGDEVLIIFSSRCIDSWWQSGGLQTQAELRLHSIEDGFAIPGPWSVPNAPSNVSPTTMQIRSTDGLCYIELAPGGKVNIVAPGGITINGEVLVEGDLQLTGSLSGPQAEVERELVINGAVVASGDGIFGGIDVATHVHGGVTTGSHDTGPPL